MKGVVLKYYPFFLLLLLCGFYAFKAIDFPVHDFANYYFGGKFLADGTFDNAIYFPYEFNKMISDLGHKGIFASYAPNTPFLACVFYPFSFFSVAMAKIIFNCISVALFLYSLKRLFTYYGIASYYLLLIPVVFFIPIKNEILFGQVYFLLFFLLSESWLSYEKNQLKKMALLLSLALLIKVFPVFLILIFLFRKEFKAVFYIGVASTVLILLSIAFTGIDVWVFYLNTVLPKASNGEIATAFVANYQSVFMFLKQLFVYDNPENTNAFFDYPTLFAALVLAYKMSLLTIGFYVARKCENSLLVFGYWLFAIILMSPYGSTYTFILLLFLFLALVRSEFSIAKKTGILLVLFLANNIPLSLFLDNVFPFSYWRLFMILVLFVFLMIVVSCIVNWKIVAGVSIVPLFLVLIFTESQAKNSKAVLNKNAPILIYDYQVSKSGITYFYWDQKGAQSQFIPLINSTSKAIDLNENQIFRNKKQLAFDKSNKLKPIIIDDTLLVYLTDIERGIGFFTLRKIMLKPSIHE